jgi:hypothetical protein
VRVSGRGERLGADAKPQYRVEVTSLDQFEAIRKP